MKGKMKKMNGADGKQAQKGRIKTVFEFVPKDELDDENSDATSQLAAFNPSKSSKTAAGPDSELVETSSARQIGIEIKVSQMSGGANSMTVVRPSDPDINFLSGPAFLLTKADFMKMIQEGIRISVSVSSRSNRVKIVSQDHDAPPPPQVGGASSSSASPPPCLEEKKTMKYILYQYKPRNFQQTRLLYNISDEDFIRSLCDSELCGGWKECSGKSGSIFWYSSDRKYIMKSISQEEAGVMKRLSSSYIRYMGSHPHSLLCRIYGMYKITTTVAAPSVIRGSERPSRVRANVVQTMRFVIMNNVFDGLTEGGQKFDLKGTTEDRFVKSVTGTEVMKDLNFVSRMVTLPDTIAECLQEVIHEDCEFLGKHGIMDYSMIVGVQPSQKYNTIMRLSRPWSDDLMRSDANKKPSNKAKVIREKIERNLRRAKTAVQNLLTPAPERRRKQSSPLPINPGDIDERRGAELDVFSPTTLREDSGVEETGRTPNASVRIPSVFSSFNGGIAGVNEGGNEAVVYYLGIIDILQEYTLKKKAAHCLKKFSIGCCHEIDTVAPDKYRNRFEKYMNSKIRGVDTDDIAKLRRSFFESWEEDVDLELHGEDSDDYNDH
jgi:hypothetical protein